MDAINQETLVVLCVVVAFVLVALIAYQIYKKRQTRILAQRFGPEYGLAVEELGSQTKAEAELMTRQKRVEQLEVVPLLPTDAARFNQAWNGLQRNFVDSPAEAVVQADALIRDVLAKRGYPMSDFDRRAADISVDHPAVVSNYRAAQAIAERNKRGEASTEELRKAVVHYRALFDELLEVEVREPVRAKNRITQLETHHARPSH